MNSRIFLIVDRILSDISVFNYTITNLFRWRAKPLTREHKPESEEELARIEEAGGKKTA